MTAAPLLAWYDRHARRLPWRVGPKDRARGVRPDPYRVWLSEIMLQQTTVAAVKPYFDAFLARWPDVAALARAPREEVMKAWAGLGYYARARNLHACAIAVANDHGGRFPETAAGLKTLPGIGDYTAAAIAAIAFDETVAVIDGNIERVIARLIAIDTPLPAAKKEIRARQQVLTPETRAGDYAQAMMDLGAAICTPKKPACALCPLSDNAWRMRAARRSATRSRRRRAFARRATASPSSPSATTARCSSGDGRTAACSAAWRRSPEATGRAAPAINLRRRTPRLRPNGAACPAPWSTCSRISGWN